MTLLQQMYIFTRGVDTVCMMISIVKLSSESLNLLTNSIFSAPESRKCITVVSTYRKLQSPPPG